MPLYYKAVNEYSPIITSIAIFPLTFTIAPAGTFASILITIYGKYHWAIWSSWTITTLGLGILCLLDIHTSITQWIFLNAVSRISLRFIPLAMASAIQTSVSRENMPMALAIFSFFRSLGQAIGVAIGGAIFQNQIITQLQEYLSRPMPTLMPLMPLV
jgi:hypothetical protein